MDPVITILPRILTWDLILLILITISPNIYPTGKDIPFPKPSTPMIIPVAYVDREGWVKHCRDETGMIPAIMMAKPFKARCTG